MMGAPCEHNRHRAVLLLLLCISSLITASHSHRLQRNDRHVGSAEAQQGTSSGTGAPSPGRVLAANPQGRDPPGRAFGIRSRPGGVAAYLDSLGSSKLQRILKNSKWQKGTRQDLETLLQNDADLVSWLFNRKCNKMEWEMLSKAKKLLLVPEMGATCRCTATGTGAAAAAGMFALS